MRRALGWSVGGLFLFAFSACGGGSSAPVANNSPPPAMPAMPAMPAAGMPGGAAPLTPGAPGQPPGAEAGTGAPIYPTSDQPGGAPGYPTPGQPGAAPGYPTPGQPGAPSYPTPGAPGTEPMPPLPGAPGDNPMPPLPGVDGNPMPPLGNPGGNPMPPLGAPGAIGPGGPDFGSGAPNYGASGSFGESNHPKSFAEAAEQAFKNGRDRDAFQLLYARTLAELKADDAAGINVRYIAGLTRPAAALRWGLGVQYTPERGYEGALPELGKPPQGGEAAGNDPANPGGGGYGREGRRPRGGNRQPGGPGGPGGVAPGGPGMPGGPGGASGDGPPADPQGMLHYYTGELGDKILQRLRKNAAKGLYGEMHKAFVTVAPAGGGQPPPGGERGPGMMMPPGVPGVPGGPGNPGGGIGSGVGGKDEGAGQLAAGIVMLGKGTAKDLLDKAREEGVELLLVFEVSATRTRTGKESGDTKMRLVDPLGGKDLYTSKKLNNIQVYDAREKPGARGADPIDDVVELLFKAVDEKNFKLSDLPATLTAEHVQSRYDKLMAQEHDNPLPVLVELRHYYRMKLLPGKLMFEGYKKLLGDEKADLLAKGKIEQKREALADWLPDDLTIASAGAATGASGTAAPGGYPPGGSVPGYSPPGVDPRGSAPPGSVPPGVAPVGVGSPGPSSPMPVLGSPPGGPGAQPAPAPGKGLAPPGSPGPAALGTGSPGPAALGTGSPGPAALGTGSPGPAALGTGSPGPGAPAPGSPAPASGAQKFEIPGSKLSLPIPTGFTLGADAHGPLLTNGAALIRVKRDERPLKTVIVDYSAENLSKSGFKLSEKQDLGQFSIVRAVHSESKLNYVFAIVPDSETSVLIVSASFSPEDEAKLAPAIMSAAAGLQLGK